MESSKKQYVYKMIMAIVLTAFITALATSLVMYNYYGIKPSSLLSSNTNKTNNISIFNSKINGIKNKINKSYLGEIKDDELLEGAIKGYVSGLDDPYSEYFTKEEMDEYTEETLGEYVGIGITMTKNKTDNTILIIEVKEGSPAKEAGIQPGDVIVSVDGREVNGDNYSKISSMIKGKEGSKVNVGVKRGENTINFDVTRKSIKIDHVASEMLENDIGYIYISSFEGGSAEEFENHYLALVDKGMKKLIIDIRNNGGGVVDEALEIADLMTNKNETLLISKDKDEKEEVRKAKEDKTITMPVVLLVNSESASASEILAGILKEKVDNATVVGTKTYGKGVIQTLYSLADGSGLKLTTEEYYTPNHEKINKIGIEPDVEVKLPENLTGTITKDQDTQLQKAIELLK